MIEKSFKLKKLLEERILDCFDTPCDRDPSMLIQFDYIMKIGEE